MRIVMMGTGPFAVPTFLALLESRHEVVALITRPSPPVKGRGPAPANPMREAAEARGVRVLAPDSINSDDARRELAALQADLFVVCDYGQILKAETLSLAPLGGINLHGSILPKYRGAAPLNWAIWNGDTETGVTVIHMTPKLDGGPMLDVRRTAIGPDETAAQLEPRLSQLGVQAVLDSIERLTAWDRVSPLGEPQDPSFACKAPRLKKSDGDVDWSQPAIRIFNQIRALKPWPGTYSHWLRPNGEPLRVILEDVVVVPDAAPNLATITAPVRSCGEVAISDGTQLIVACGGGQLSLRRVQPAGKRSMEIAEFLRGYPVRVGERLGGTLTT